MRVLSVVFAAFVTLSAFGQSSDIAITKDGPGTTTADADVIFNVHLVNTGPDASGTVTMNDDIPAGMSFKDLLAPETGGWVCSTPNIGDTVGSVTCSTQTMLVNDTADFQITFHTDPSSPAGTTFINTATVSSPTDPTDENNSATWGVTIPQPFADLSIDKSGPQSAGPNTDVTYTITLTNAGPNDATNVTVTDTLPGDMTFVGIGPFTGIPLNCTTPAAGSGGTITCTAGTYVNGGQTTFTITGHIPDTATSGTPYANSVTVTSDLDPNSENDESNTQLTVSTVDLAVVKSGPATGTAGQPLTYTITLTNNGPDFATDARFDDVLPAGTTFASIVQNSGPAFVCSTPPADTNGAVGCLLTVFAPNAPAVFTLTVNVDPAYTDNTTLTNTATTGTSSYDTNVNNNQSSTNATIAGLTDVSVTKAATTSSVNAGSNITYTVTVANNGANPALNTHWTDTLPAGTTFVSLTQTSGPAFTCTTGAAIDCSIATFATPSTATFTLVVKTAPSATGTVSNTANVTTATLESDTTNNSSTSSVTLTQSADVSVTKSGPAVAIQNQDVTYTITVHNNGPSDAASVTLTDTIPSQATFVSMTQTGGPAFNCSGTTTQTCTIATLAAGATSTFSLTVHTNATVVGGMTNTASVSSSTPDPNTNNNTASAATNLASADVAVTKSAAPAQVSPGTNVTWTITAANNGPDAATNVTLNDVLPANTTFVSLTQNSGPAFTCTTGATVNCTIASFAANSSAMFTLVTATATTTPPGPLSNTATISAASPFDTTPGNNTSTATTTIITADLAVTKVGAPAQLSPGGNVTWTITATNNGPDTATNVTLTDVLPANTTFVSLTQNSGPAFTCTTGATVTCTAASFAASATATFTLVAATSPTTPAGALSNTATIAAASPLDQNPGNNSATAATTIITADLSVTKSAPAQLSPGNDITWTINVANAGPNDAINVTLHDALPANTTFLSLTQNSGPAFTCTTGATIDCTIATFTNGASASFTLIASTAASTPPGPLTNTTTINAQSPLDPNLANNTSASTTTIITADLAVTKSGSAQVSPGGNVTWTISVINNGPNTATNVTLHDALPANTTFVSLTQNSGPAFTCTTGATVDCTIASLASGAAATFTLVGTVPANTPAGPLPNTATISAQSPADQNATNNTATSTTAIVTADLAVTKNASPAQVSPGGTITWTVAVVNNGPNTATNVTLHDALPASTTFVSLTQNSGPAFTCTTGAVVDCTIASLANGAAATFTIVASAAPNTPAGALPNTATINAASPLDPIPANNTATSTTTIITADLAVTKNASPAQVSPGGTITWTVSVINNGPNTATNVTLHDALPANTTFVSLTQNSGPAFICTTGAVVDCTIASLANGAAATFTIVASAAPNTPAGALPNTATINAASPADPNPANNTATSTTTIITADLAVTKAAAPATVAAGSNVTFTITATNNGPNDATGVHVTDVLPANTTFVSFNQSSGPAFTCTTGATVDCTIGTFTSGVSATFTVVARTASGTPAGTLSSTATISAASPADPNPANNSATSSTTIALVDLSVSKTASAGPYYTSQPVTYTIVVTNNGTVPATGIVVTDPLPHGMQYVSSTPAGACSGTTTITCNAASIAGGAAATFTITANLPPFAGDVTNTATASSANGEASPANNSGAATITVVPAAAIPTLSPLLLALLAAMLAMVALRKVL